MGFSFARQNNRAQLEKVRRYLALARQEGGTVLCGETADPPLSLPEANTDVSHSGALIHGIPGIASWCRG